MQRYVTFLLLAALVFGLNLASQAAEEVMQLTVQEAADKALERNLSYQISLRWIGNRLKRN